MAAEGAGAGCAATAGRAAGGRPGWSWAGIIAPPNPPQVPECPLRYVHLSTLSTVKSRVTWLVAGADQRNDIHPVNVAVDAGDSGAGAVALITLDALGASSLCALL